MTEPAAKRVIRIDHKDIEYGSEAHINHLESAHLADLTKHETQLKELTTKCDAAEGRCDVAEKAAKKTKDDYESDEAKAKRKKRSSLIRRCIRLLASDDDGDEDKTDALDTELDALDDKAIMLRIIRTDAAYKDDKTLDDKSIDYVQAIFDGLTKSGLTRTDGVDSVVRDIERVKRTDNGERGDLVKERAADRKRTTEAWKQPLT